MDSSMQVKKTQAEVRTVPKAQSLTLAISVIKVSNSLGTLIFTDTAKNPEIYYAINPTDFSRPLLGLIIKNEGGRSMLPVNTVCCTSAIK